MKTLASPRLALLIAPLCLGLEPRGDDVSFHPKNGSSLSKDFELELSLSLDDISVVVDGQDVSEMGMPSEFDVKLSGNLSITDQYVSVASGRPLELIRAFDDVSLSWEAGEESGQADELSGLESRKVRFKWNEEDRRYDVAYHESEGDAELLEVLSEDLDLRALLPEGEVAADERWEVDAGALATVLFLGAKLDQLQTSSESDVMQVVFTELSAQMRKIGGELKTTCRYQGSRDVDGKRVGAIEIKLDGKPTLDLSNAITKAIESEAEGQDVPIDVSVKKAMLRLELAGKGELLWDLAAGHVHAFQMETDAKLDFEADVSVDVQGETHTLAARVEASGSGQWKTGAK